MDLRSPELSRFFQSVLSLKTEDECYMFFEDICTISELTAIAQRLKVAQMLKEKRTIHEISESTGISTATISRVNKCMHYGSGGYEMVLNRIPKDD